MDFSDAFTIAAPPDRVWAAMMDPDVMRRVLPGCRKLEAAGPDRFDVVLAAGIGVLRGVFNGAVVFSGQTPPERTAMDISAQGSLGRVTGAGGIELTPTADGGTTLAYRATFSFAGPMAGLGEPLMRGVATTLTRDAMQRFSAIVTGGAGAG